METVSRRLSERTQEENDKNKNERDNCEAEKPLGSRSTHPACPHQSVEQGHVSRVTRVVVP